MSVLMDSSSQNKRKKNLELFRNQGLSREWFWVPTLPEISYIMTEEISQELNEDKHWNRNDLHLGIKVGYSEKPRSTKRYL